MRKTKIDFARRLRKEATETEIIVWDALRNRRFLNLKFRRQHLIEGFVVDFYCYELRLAIEIDGAVHNNQKDYDALRQILIEDKGIHFIRVSSWDIKANISILFDAITEYKNRFLE